MKAREIVNGAVPRNAFAQGTNGNRKGERKSRLALTSAPRGKIPGAMKVHQIVAAESGSQRVAGEAEEINADENEA